MVPFLTKQTQRTIIMCAIDCSLIEMKQFVYTIHQHSVKCIDITVKLLLVLSIHKFTVVYEWHSR